MANEAEPRAHGNQPTCRMSSSLRLPPMTPRPEIAARSGPRYSAVPNPSSAWEPPENERQLCPGGQLSAPGHSATRRACCTAWNAWCALRERTGRDSSTPPRRAHRIPRRARDRRRGHLDPLHRRRRGASGPRCPEARVSRAKPPPVRPHRHPVRLEAQSRAKRAGRDAPRKRPHAGGTSLARHGARDGRVRPSRGTHRPEHARARPHLPGHYARAAIAALDAMTQLRPN